MTDIVVVLVVLTTGLFAELELATVVLDTVIGTEVLDDVARSEVVADEADSEARKMEDEVAVDSDSAYRGA